MSDLNLNNKTFSLVSNTEKGEVNTETIFKFKQKSHVVTADYYGGTIQYGKIIAIKNGQQLDMLYQCLTQKNELKAGKAIAEISQNENNKLKLRVCWEWLDNKEEKGQSEYIEN